MENTAYTKKNCQKNCIKTLLAERREKQNLAHTAELGCVLILFLTCVKMIMVT